jgi:hypothetical protein
MRQARPWAAGTARPEMRLITILREEYMMILFTFLFLVSEVDGMRVVVTERGATSTI